MQNSTCQTLRCAIDEIALVSSHEHTLPESAYHQHPTDLFTLLGHYCRYDVLAVGMTDADWQAGGADDERWNRIWPFIDRAQTTAYFRSLLYGFRTMYEFADDRLTPENWQSLNARIVGVSRRTDAYRYFLSELPRIDHIILDASRLEHNDLFSPVLRLDDLLMPLLNTAQREAIAQRTGIEIHTLDDALAALDRSFDILIAGGGVGVKSAMAPGGYRIEYDVVERSLAEQALSLILRGEGDPYEVGRPYTSYMMHAMAERAGAHNVPVQIHTGYPAGNYTSIARTNPMHLSTLLAAHPGTRFDLFHGGFPYTDEFVALAKAYPNVYADLCWLSFLAPRAYTETLRKLLETTALHRILAFGADYCYPEGTCAMAFWTRHLVAHTLAGMVDEGYFSAATACDAARRILNENVCELFNVQRERSIA